MRSDLGEARYTRAPSIVCVQKITMCQLPSSKYVRSMCSSEVQLC